MEMPEDIFNKMNIATGKLLLRNLSVDMSYSISGFCKYMKDLKCEHFNWWCFTRLSIWTINTLQVIYFMVLVYCDKKGVTYWEQWFTFWLFQIQNVVYKPKNVIFSTDETTKFAMKIPG